MGQNRRSRVRAVMEDTVMTDPKKDPTDEVETDSNQDTADTGADDRELAAEEVAAKLGDVA